MITRPVEDLYPSRVGREVSITPRKDPTVWGQEPGPLSPKELESFDRDGFLFFPDLFTPREAEALLKEAEHLRDDPSWQDREEVLRTRTARPRSRRAPRTASRSR